MGSSLRRLAIAWCLLFGLVATSDAQDAPSETELVSIYLEPCEPALDTNAFEAQLRIELKPHEVSFVRLQSPETSGMAVDENITNAPPQPTLVNIHFGRCEPDAPMALVWTNKLGTNARRIEMVDSPREDRARNLALVVTELVRDPRGPLVAFAADSEAEQENAANQLAANEDEKKDEASEDQASKEPEPRASEKKRSTEARRPSRPPPPPPKRLDAFEAGGELRWLFSGDFFLAGPLLSYSVARVSPFELSAGAVMLTGTRSESIGSVRATLLSAFVAPRYRMRLPHHLGLEIGATLSLGEVFASGTGSTSNTSEGNVRGVIADTSARAAFTALLGPLIEVGLYAGIGSMLRGLDILVRGERTSGVDGGFFNAGLVLRVPLSTSPAL